MAFEAQRARLLKEIEQNKEELAELVKGLDEEEERAKEAGDQASESVQQQIFNVGNLGALQELLEQAEQSDEVLLFTDNKKNTWQIISRKDINVGGEGNRSDSEGEQIAEPAEEKRAIVARSSGKNLDEGDSPTPHKHVSVIEDCEEGRRPGEEDGGEKPAGE